MRLFRFLIFTASFILLVTSILVEPASSAPDPLVPAGPPAIKLQAGTFVPSQGDFLPIPEAFSITPGDVVSPDQIEANQPRYYIVQFDAPIQASWKESIQAAGGNILEYIPDYAFKVFMAPEEALQVGRQPHVIWVGLFQPAFKIEPAMLSDDLTLVKIRAESNSTIGETKEAIEATGATILRRDGDRYAVLSANQRQVAALARIAGIAWIEDFAYYEKHNEYGAGVILGANIANANGYDGSSQIAAVADTGIGGGTKATAHPDIPANRIVAIQDFPTASVPLCYTAFPDGAKDVDSGHGTHTAISVLGDGGPSGEGKGTAPAARLVFQSVEDYVAPFGLCAGAPGYYLTGLPLDLHDLYRPAYNAGARIHSNSWGNNAAGTYTADSAASDDFMWRNQDILITFSAGNAGTDDNNNGIVDSDSMGAPATAKNVLTVGASENDRGGNWHCDTSLGYISKDSYQNFQTCSAMGGNQANFLGTWGERYGSRFNVEPLNSDLTAGDAGQMAAWSSRGPTDDGRIKPDIVAPGSWVLSGYSELYQQGYGDPQNPQNNFFQYDGWGLPFSETYKYMGGTSMSNPIAAGAAAVVRDYYKKAQGHDASAALVKATLINSAVDLLDENNDGVDDNNFPIPNIHEGWGLVNLVNATDDSHLFVDNTAGVRTGEMVSYPYTINTGSDPFKITLVWTDYPSTETAAANLVNNLNLTVRGPGGTPVYRGNVFNGGWSQSGGSNDNTNNVENVFIQSAAPGTWTIEVRGANVPQGPQPFALVVDGVSEAAPPPDPDILYVSSSSGGVVAGLRFSDEDILSLDIASGAWSLYFDGSDVGLSSSGARDTDALFIQDDGSILLSMVGDTTLPGVGSVDDSDIIRFIPTTLGPSTNGTFELYFDGSDVGLNNIGEDVDALSLLANGDLLLSTSGRFAVNNLSGGHEDLIRFSPTALGANTSGSWSLYFDGSDVGLGNSSAEDIWGAWVNESSGAIFLSTRGDFSLSGLSGGPEDIFLCQPDSLGNNTSCSKFQQYWAGSAVGFAGERIDAFFVEQGN